MIVKDNESLFRHLIFRRQFLLGSYSNQFPYNNEWKTYLLHHELVLFAHPDLNVYISSYENKKLVLIGFAVDALNPRRSIYNLLQQVVQCANEISQVVNNTRSFAGRWVIVFQNSENTYIFTDPCGFRSVYYAIDDSGIWCGSQPEILKSVVPLSYRSDPVMDEFLLNEKFCKNESAWVGDKTIYQNCWHLLPNHYFDLNETKQIRFFPTPDYRMTETDHVVEFAASLLKNIIEGIVLQGKVVQGLTAGWDSRVLLAASKEFSNQILYFVDKQGVLSDGHSDIEIPRKLSKHLGLNFKVLNSKTDLPGWFVNLLSHNVTGGRVLSKTRTIYSHFLEHSDFIKINGNGSEICRNFFDKFCRYKGGDFTSSDLATLMGYANIKYVEKELEGWLDSIELSNVKINVLDLLYWEQRLGNWGALYPSEQDIAIEEVSPFNCRLLIEVLLSAPKELRCAPNYLLYKKLIEVMWPETLAFPINPDKRSWKKRIKNFISKWKLSI